MRLVPQNTPPVSMRMLRAAMSPSTLPLARISRWPAQMTSPWTVPAITTSVPRTPPRTTPLSPTTTEACDSTDPSIVPSMRNAPSAVRSPLMRHDRPMTFSMASLFVAAPSRFDPDPHAMRNLRIAIEGSPTELKAKSQT